MNKRTILILVSMAVVGLAGFVFLVPGRRSGRPIAGDIIHGDLLRGVLFVVWVALLWGIGYIWRVTR
jgi:hypothetical protein